MKKIIILFLFITSIMGQNSKLTLEESIKIGLENSTEIDVNKIDIEIAKANLRIANSNYFPKLSLSSSYNYISKTPVQFNQALPFFNVPTSEMNMFYSSATIDQPIFTGFKIFSGKQIALTKLENDNLELDKKKIDKTFEITKHFLNVYKTEMYVNLAKDRMNYVEQLFSDSKKMLKNGLITDNDLLKVESKLVESKAKLTEVENLKKLAIGKFNLLIGKSVSVSTEIDTNLIWFSTNKSYRFEELVESAKLNRIEILKQKKFNEIITNKIKIEQSDYYPQLFASASYNLLQLKGNDLLNDDLADYWMVSLNAKWKLWNWWETASRVKIAEQELLKSQLAEQAITENIELEVYKVYLNFLTLSENLESRELLLKSAIENQRVVKSKFSNETAKTIDVIEAGNELYSAKIKLLEAKIDLFQAQIEVKKVTGENLNLRKN